MSECEVCGDAIHPGKCEGFCYCACHEYWPDGEPSWVHEGECRCNGDEYPYTPRIGDER